MTGPARDLAGFRKPNRPGGLAGKLGPRSVAPTSDARPVNETPAGAAPVVDEELATNEPETASQREHAPTAAAPPAGSPRQNADGQATDPEQADQRKRSWSVYLPGPLFEKAREAQGRRSYGEIVLDAFEYTYDQLPDHFRPPTESKSGLPPRARRPRRDVENLQEVHLRWTKQEFDVVEARRIELGAPGRSEFITVMLDHYLDGTGPG